MGADTGKAGFSLPGLIGRGEAAVIGNNSFNQSPKNTHGDHATQSLVGSDTALNNSNVLGEEKENSYAPLNSVHNRAWQDKSVENMEWKGEEQFRISEGPRISSGNSRQFTAQQVNRPKKRWVLASKARKGAGEGEYPY